MRYFASGLIALYAFIAVGQDAPAPSVTPVAPAMTAPKITVPAVTAPLAPSVPAPAVAAPVQAPVQTPAKAPAEAASPPAAPVANETQPSPANTAPAPTDSAAPGTAAAANTVTNEPPPPPVKDPAKCVVARFGFDGNFLPDVGGSTIPVTFSRLSASYVEGVPVSENAPRFIEGRSGKAVMIESAYANYFSIAQSSAAETGAFKPVQGAVLSISTDQPWQGKEALAVETKGENSEEGFSAETQVEKAFYTKENGAIVPAYYVASLYLKGQGNLKLVLKDVESGTASEPVYVDLQQGWQRFSCLFAYPFQRRNIGANHETDWRNSLPAGTNLNSHLQLICTTVDSQKMNFSVDGLQLEQRNAFVSSSAELSPHSWVLGAFFAKQEQLAIDVRNDYFKTWKKTGTIAFWFKPLWEARDNSIEIILQVAKNQLSLAHDRQKLIFSPAGVAFTPSEWKNSWHHIVVTWNEAGERALYLDGMDYPNTDGQAMPLKDPESVMLGDFTRNLSPNGAIDDLTLYNITLNSDQTKALAIAEPAAVAQPAETAPAPQKAEPAAAVPAEQKTDESKAPAAPAAKDEEEEEEK
jgi:hypothetical protein